MKMVITMLVTWLLTGALAYADDLKDEEAARFRSYIKQVKCGEILAEVEDPGVKQGVVLVVGSFISGSNFAKHRVSGLDLKGMLLLTEQFCRQNPEATLLQALVSLDARIDRASGFLQSQTDN